MLTNRGKVEFSNQFEQNQKKYPLLSKRILNEYPQDILINFLDLRAALREKVGTFEESTFGVYFEYLPTGTSIGVNERYEVYAASLFKLPVIMTYYRWKERTGRNDDPKLIVKESELDSNFGNLWKKGAGYKIRLSEAVRLAIIESDNTAARVIVSYLKEEEDFKAVYEGLDIDLKTDSAGTLLTAKSYSSILKALYFSAVLNKDDSNEILNLLTKTNFPDKLAAGVPQSIPVAHKIGNYIGENENDLAYSDCGIVYVPRRPYILCMVSVSNEDVARERMQSISRIVYDFVSRESN